MPPNPDAVLSVVESFNSLFFVIIFIFPETPLFLYPIVFMRLFLFIFSIRIADSITPAAPNVCPKYPFSEWSGVSLNPSRLNAIDSISSLYFVAVPCAEIISISFATRVDSVNAD